MVSPTTGGSLLPTPNSEDPYMAYLQRFDELGKQFGVDADQIELFLFCKKVCGLTTFRSP